MPVKINGKEFSDDQAQALIDAGLMGTGEKNNPYNTDYQLQAAHGTWSDGTSVGLFTRPGVDPNMLSAIRYPEARLIAQLYAGVTDERTPEYSILTGVDAGQGSNASDWCGEAPRAGFVRIGTTRSQFGEFKMQTNSVKLAEIGGRINRADVDRNVINMPDAFPLMPSIVGGLASGGNSLNTALGLEVFSLGIHLQRVMGRVLFHGNRATASGSTELGFMREFDGFDQLIVTGYEDIDSGLKIPAADSIVQDYNNVNISTGTSDIVDVVSGILFALEERANQGNLGDMWDGFLAMHPDLFHALTRVWPCSYLTDGCSVTNNDGERLNVTGAEQVAMRDEMRNGRFLWVLGKRLPVYTTRAIERTVNGPGFDSTIYWINTGVPGMGRTTYIEGFDMGRADVAAWTNLLPGGEISVLNNGFYLSTFNRRGTCVEYEFNAMPRLVMRTPWLCARIENVTFTLERYSDDDQPSEQYYRNGGRYLTTYPTGTVY
jgi:hypothetical protein